MSTAGGATEEWLFQPEAEGARMARRRVQALLEAQALDAAANTAALLVSELATNVVLHARTDFEVRVSVRDGVVRIEVHDRNGRPPVVRHFSNQSTSGRGLRLVDELASAWGTEPDGDGAGKTVWVELDATPEPAAFDLDAVEEL